MIKFRGNMFWIFSFIINCDSIHSLICPDCWIQISHFCWFLHQFSDYSFIHPAGFFNLRPRIIHCRNSLLRLLKKIRVDIVIDSLTDICINQDDTDDDDGFIHCNDHHTATLIRELHCTQSYYLHRDPLKSQGYFPNWNNTPLIFIKVNFTLDICLNFRAYPGPGLIKCIIRIWGPA